jgi:aminopeptidase N
MSRIDPHSFHDSAQPAVRHAQLDWRVDFQRSRLVGRVDLALHAPADGALDLDAKGLEIHAVQDGLGQVLAFELSAEQPILGQRLRVHCPAGTRQVVIDYATSPDAAGLQWLEPAQTAGGRLPFVFSQCQPIHARTLLPVQDTPAVRITYAARVAVPTGQTAVMSAAPTGSTPGPEPGWTTFAFDMPQPIPPYLLALAVGELQAHDLSARARVWAEPATLAAAAWEFAAIEGLIETAERLFGPYDWERYDMLVLPPAFPYGGMENPRMTFLTPTLLAGDRSLVDVVAHELAHSWTGNLVTNASMEHFWLNEGFTVWAERRILEALHGEHAAMLSWALGQRALNEALQRFGADSPLTCLRTRLDGVDPDDVFSSVPYEKGARFVALLERSAGRARFDAFVRAYMARFRFTSISSETFLEFLEQHLPGLAAQVGAQRWLYEPGLPDNAPAFHSAALEQLVALAEAWPQGARPGAEQVARWQPTELLVYLQHLPRGLDTEECRWLDEHLALMDRGNHEVLVEWLVIAASSDYAPAFERLREVLLRVGRVKYLRPLYGALGRHPRTRALARRLYAEARPGYHALSRRVTESVLASYATD